MQSYEQIKLRLDIDEILKILNGVSPTNNPTEDQMPIIRSPHESGISREEHEEAHFVAKHPQKTRTSQPQYDLSFTIDETPGNKLKFEANYATPYLFHARLPTDKKKRQKDNPSNNRTEATFAKKS